MRAQLYFLSDQYYQDFPDDKLMQNKDNRVVTDVERNARNVLAMAKRGAKVIFPDVFKIYQGLEQQLQRENMA